MFLTSLTLRGFKSFADTTTLEFGPGLTTIVGPNGSGKSNIVDALAWVMGTAAPTKVRSGEMADVIFGGSPNRSPLGQARVEITVDNAQGQLGTGGMGTTGSAQEFSEVRIAREVYASGESTYEINGEEVRALDVQELLSDAGLGRELHTIVGQGELDEILQARPEERRAHIEEAAGILKHRRRRERASRKLERVDDHIDKLATILGELRKQLEPLERQAEAASTHSQLQASLREVRMRLAANRVAAARGHARRQQTEESRRSREADQARSRVEELEGEVHELEDDTERLSGELEDTQATLHRLGSLLERLRGTSEVIEAHRRHLVESLETPVVGRPPAELAAEAERTDARRQSRQAEQEAARAALEQAVQARREAESARRQHEASRQVAARQHVEQREQRLRWEMRVSSLRGSIEASESELERVRGQLEELEERVVGTREDIERVQSQIQRLDADEAELTAELDAAETDVTRAEQQLQELVERQRELERARSREEARAEALSAALQDQQAGATALLEEAREGVLGTVDDFLRVDERVAAPLDAALGQLREAVVVTTPDQARRSITWLRTQGEVGGAVVLAARSVAVPEPELDDETAEQLRTAGAVPASRLLHPSDRSGAGRVVEALSHALSRCWVVEHWDRAVLLHGRNPGLAFVTRDGDRAGPRGFASGTAAGPSRPRIAAAAERAQDRAEHLGTQLEDLDAELQAAHERLRAARERRREATDQLNESDARITGAAERLARLDKELVAATNQRDVMTERREELEDALDQMRQQLAELEAGPPTDEAVRHEPAGPQHPDPHSADDGRPSGSDTQPSPWAARARVLEAEVEDAREVEVSRRVTCERLEEQILHLREHAAELCQQAEQARAATARAARRREVQRRGVQRCGQLAALCTVALEALEASVADARSARQDRRERLEGRRARLAEAREALREARTAQQQATELHHQARMQRAEADSELDQLDEQIREQFAMTADELVQAHPQAAEEDRDELAQQEEVLARKLDRLGRVNPLALEEFRAMEDRHRFLSDQLEDLRASKHDLQDVIDAVDTRIRRVFEDAFQDVQSEFQRVFEVLFPGGQGRLELTEPDDLLSTGVEIRPRLPGKRVTRLSLLSGGERSLTVLAFVFAIFRARPSPFYVLDEVDAALDDANLQRLLEVIESFREHAQVLLVTHQKRTMEVADLMYGCTMNGEAVTKVVCERPSETERPEPALPAPRQPGRQRLDPRRDDPGRGEVGDDGADPDDDGDRTAPVQTPEPVA